MKYVVLYSTSSGLSMNAEEFDVMTEAIMFAGSRRNVSHLQVGTFTPLEWQAPKITRIRSTPWTWANRSLVFVDAFGDGDMEPGHTVTSNAGTTRVYINSLGAIFRFQTSSIRWDNAAMDARERLDANTPPSG